MDNVILRTTLSLTWKLLAAYSLYILLRGHNEPGGGFIGGLLLALGIILRGYIANSNTTEDKLRDGYTAGLGLSGVVFLCLIMLPVVMGHEVLKGLWTSVWIPIAGKFSSVLIFDTLVYLIVATSALYAHSALYTPGHRGQP